MNKKIFASAISRNVDWQQALKEISTQIKKDMHRKDCDLLVYFVSEAYPEFDPKAFLKRLSDLVPYKHIMGCNSSGVLANETEIEMEPGVAMMALHLPDVKMHPFYMSGDETNLIQGGPALINFLDVYPTHHPKFLCLGDPATTDIGNLMKAFNEGFKGMPVVGGLASGGVLGVPNWMCLDGTIYTEGLVGMAFTGDVGFEVLVAQGARPVGKTFAITKAQDNVLFELAGKPALEILRDLMTDLSEKDKQLAEHSLSVGFVMNEAQGQFKRGDFLIRNIVGFDPDVGALVIGASLKLGQTIQFHVRDAATSSEDLHGLLDQSKKLYADAKAAFLVSCCGRGKHFYGTPHHDTKAIQKKRGPIPLVGFFANGEIGPVGQKNYIHGYTSSLVIFH